MVTSVEMMFVLLAGLAALVFIGYLGRLHAAGIEVQQATHAAARAASLSSSSDAARSAAADALAASALASRCSGTTLDLAWSPSPTGTWQGGAVTITLTCEIDNRSLAGVWSPGTRTVRSVDTQPIDRYQR